MSATDDHPGRGMTMMGAVLTGGRSSRMGIDKATIEVDGRSMVDRVGAVLDGVCDEVVAVGPPGLAGSLSPLADRFPGDGPVGGILTALTAASAGSFEWAMVLACDLPWIDAATVNDLADARSEGSDVIVARTLHVEPMCAIWRTSVIGVLQQSFDDGERAVHRCLARLAVRAVDVAERPLRNINTPADLQF